jgi:hypothetical protein
MIAQGGDFARWLSQDMTFLAICIEGVQDLHIWAKLQHFSDC